MKNSTMLATNPVIGRDPYLDQAVRDRFDDTGVLHSEYSAGSAGAMHAEAVTAP